MTIVDQAFIPGCEREAERRANDAAPVTEDEARCRRGSSSSIPRDAVGTTLRDHMTARCGSEGEESCLGRGNSPFTSRSSDEFMLDDPDARREQRCPLASASGPVRVRPSRARGLALVANGVPPSLLRCRVTGVCCSRRRLRAFEQCRPLRVERGLLFARSLRRRARRRVRSLRGLPTAAVRSASVTYAGRSRCRVRRLRPPDREEVGGCGRRSPRRRAAALGTTWSANTRRAVSSKRPLHASLQRPGAPQW